MLNLIRSSRLNRCLPIQKGAISILGVHKCVPVLQFFESFAKVVQHLLADEFNLARCVHRPSKPWNGFNDESQIAFSGPKGFLSAFAVVDIREQEIPADDLTLRISLRELANFKPTVYAVGPAHAVLNRLRLTGFNGVS